MIVDTQRKIILFSLIFIVSALRIAKGEKILGLFPLSSKSHMNMFGPVLLELASKGHEITVVASEKPNFQIPNIAELEIAEIKAIFSGDGFKDVFNNTKENSFMRILSFPDEFLPFCKMTLASPVTKELVNKGQVYDLVLVSGYLNECAVQIAPMLAKYIVMISASPVGILLTFPYTSYPSFVPERTYDIPPRMNFIQRLQNSFGVFLGRKVFQWIHWKSEELVLESIPNAPTMNEAQDKISLILLNVDPILSVPQPITPRIIPVGGMHLRKAKSLTKDYEELVESSGNEGFIIFTMGSFTPSELMPEDIRDAFLSAFSRLKQKVIWKYKGEIENLPSNVILTSWLPQQDLLAHPKARLLITHGGLLSLQEAIYYGVPVIGVPLFGDHPGNLALIKTYGLGSELKPFLSLTADKIYQIVNDVLKDQSYYENMKKYSSIMRDQLVPPVKRATFWVEYVLRHNGAHHLRSPGEDLGFIEYFLLDVIALSLLFTIIILWLIKKTIALFFSYFIKKNTYVKKEKIK